MHAAENTSSEHSGYFARTSSGKEPSSAEKSASSQPDSEESKKSFENWCNVINKENLKKVFKKIEMSAATEEERIAYFVENSKGKLRLWWCGLGIKPNRWSDLKNWLVEDLGSLRTMETRDNLYCGRGFPGSSNHRNSHSSNAPYDH